MDKNENNSSTAIKAVDNALAVLEVFGEVGGDIRIAQLSERLGINKSYIFRVLATLETRGYVEKGKTSGAYRLGPSAYFLGQKFLSSMDLLTKSRPIMQRLARQCNEAVYLAIRRRREILMLDMVDGFQPIGILPLIGNLYPLSSNAAGKAVCECRASTDIGGLGKEIASVAAPLFDAEVKVMGSLCIAGPEFRMPRERVGELLLCVIEACEEISSMFNCATA